MIHRIKKIPFSTKLMLVFALALTLTLLLVALRQITNTYSLLEEKSTSQLAMVTDQVMLNFEDSVKGVEKSSYTSMVAFDTPGQMARHVSTISLRKSLATMVTASSPYDYVLIRTNYGDQVDAATMNYPHQEVLKRAEEEAAQILEQHKETSYGRCEWYRSTSGEVYMLRDVYDVTPIHHVGTMVLHMKQPLFPLSEGCQDTTFLFYRKDGTFIASAGTQVTQELIDQVTLDAAQQNLASRKIWSGDEYFVSYASTGDWVTVGMISTYSYRQGCTRIVSEMLLVGAVGLAFGVLLVYFLSHRMLGKLRKVKVSMDRVAEGDFSQRITVTGEDDISQLAVTFNYMSDHIAHLLEQLVEKERMRSNAEMQVLEYKYRSLETQIRPHFIYNALETINAIAKIKGNDEIVEIVQRISRYFRSITLNTTHQFITVQQEFDNLQDYTEIYRFIHGDGLKTIFSARETARNAMIPTMILQPIVENALHYGLRSQNEDSEVRIHAYAKNGKLFITVKDRGRGLTPEQTESIQSGQPLSRSGHTGIGLTNVRERLQLIYGDSSSITLRNRENGGVKVTIEIPFAYTEPDDMEELDDWSDLDDLDLS